MNKTLKILLNIGLFTSLFFGLWHFIIPYQFKWYDFLPNAPRAIIVSIDWINFFFSLLLTGNSFLLLINQKEIISGQRGIYSFYVLLVIVWFSRVVITIWHPWNKDYLFIDFAQIAIFTIVFLMLFFPMIYYSKRH